MAERSLTPRQDIFCRVYAETSNGYQSCKAAGYAESQWHKLPSELLKKEHIRKKVAEYHKQRADELCLDTDKITIEMYNIFKSCSNKIKIEGTDSEKMIDAKAALLAIEKLSERLGLNEVRAKENTDAKKLYEILSDED